MEKGQSISCMRRALDAERDALMHGQKQKRTRTQAACIGAPNSRRGGGSDAQFLHATRRMEGGRRRWNLRFADRSLGVVLDRLGLTARPIPSRDRGAVRVCKPTSGRVFGAHSRDFSAATSTADGVFTSGMRQREGPDPSCAPWFQYHWVPEQLCYYDAAVMGVSASAERCPRSNRSRILRGSRRRCASCQCVLNASTRRM